MRSVTVPDGRLMRFSEYFSVGLGCGDPLARSYLWGHPGELRGGRSGGYDLRRLLCE